VTRLSAKFILEIVRYEIIMEKTDKYMINNNFTAYYGRLFVEEFPEHKNKFEFRKINLEMSSLVS
jgi:hypothetical protein